MSLKKDDVVECTIESLAFGGRGVARVDGMAVFVAGGLPGDTVSARIVRAKKRFAEAVAESVLKPSADRVEPQCRHFGECGGCAMQDLDYDVQLEQKAAQVEASLSRIGGVESLVMDEPIGSPVTWGYRNKMEFAFEQRADGVHLGLRSQLPAGEKGLAPVLDIEECKLCDAWDVEIMQATREFCRESGVAAYHPQTRSGFWRHLVIRHTSVGEVMVHLITTADERKYSLVKKLGEMYVDRFPGIASFVHSTRERRSTLAFGEEMQSRMGLKFVEERLVHDDREARYHLSPNAFFQTNSLAAGKLFGTIAEYGDFTGNETLLDLYCGAGAIGIFLADRVFEVIGYELNEESVSKAWASAKLNNLTNCRFVSGSLDRGIEDMDSIPRPDVVVVDPPRSGMQERTAESVLKLAPKKIILVSCDPATLGRDVKRLASKYDLKRAKAVDMFPHTHHIETVALLVKK